MLAELDRQQRDRLRQKGKYHLDRPEYAAFYRKLVRDGISDGNVVLTALTCPTKSWRPSSASRAAQPT